MSASQEKEIKYKIYLEAEKIRLAKIKIKQLKEELNKLQGYSRVKRKDWREGI